MRTINLSDTSTVEVWPGRRMLTRDGLFALPKGSIELNEYATSSRISLGNINRTTCYISGPAVPIKAVFDAIIEMERPGEGVKTIQ